MYAIIEEGGRQLRVEEGQELCIDFQTPGEQKAMTFDRVIALRNSAGFQVGTPHVKGAQVQATILGVEQGPKLIVQKFRRRKNYRRKTGHRSLLTRIKIDKITPA